MDSDGFTTTFDKELKDACAQGKYVSVLIKGTYKYMSGKVVLVKDDLLKLRNDKGDISIRMDEVRSFMTYEKDRGDE